MEFIMRQYRRGLRVSELASHAHLVIHSLPLPRKGLESRRRKRIQMILSWTRLPMRGMMTMQTTLMMKEGVGQRGRGNNVHAGAFSNETTMQGS